MESFILITWSIIVIFNVVPNLNAKATKDDSLFVNTSLGSLKGILKKSFTEKTIRVFYKVPFAEPPVGKLRFKPPEPIKAWKGTLDNTKFGPPCIQKTLAIFKQIPILDFVNGLGVVPPSEDCLYLNIYLPKEVKEKTAVMVYIYGGGFMSGTANSEIYDSSSLVAEEDIILVTFNYRVNTFGFLYLGIDGAPGNMGLMDQAMALRWIQSHISSFGGDPDRVTVFGQSAGSISIAHHLYINSSEGLFQRGILQSGVAHMQGAYDTRENLLKSSLEFADFLDCKFDSSDMKKTLDCLMKKDANELNDNQVISGFGFNLFFKPVVDGNYITEHPLTATKNSAHKRNISLIIGHVEHEASMFLLIFDPIRIAFVEEFLFTEDDFRNLVQVILNIKNNSVIVDTVLSLYSDWTIKDPSKRLIDNVVRSGSELMFLCPSLLLENTMLEANNTVYKYRYREKNVDIQTKKWMGIIHGTDIGSVFGAPLNPRFNGSREFSRNVMRYWANFARTGNPNNSPNRKDLPIWPPMTKEDKIYFVLDQSFSQTGYLSENKCFFINKLASKIYELENQTLPIDSRMILRVGKNKFDT